MAYKTDLEFKKRISLKNAGITVHVDKDGRKFGRLEINRAGVKWLAEGKKKHGPDVFWDKLAEILQENK